MKSLRKITSELVGFDRRERRGSYILSVILIIVLLIRVFAFRPGKEPVSAMVTPEHITALDGAVVDEETSLFSFDPNDASFDDLVRLGLTERQASTLINYRSAGARFRNPDDIRRVYGIDSATCLLLIPYITIREEAFEPVRKAEPAAGQIASDSVTSDEPAAPLIDINLCSAADLLPLPGIGPVLSERIIKYRRLLGGFVDIEQLSEVYGLDSNVISVIEPALTLTFDSVSMLMLDSCSYSEMARHPYLGPEASRLIVKYRSLTGRPVTLGDLVSQHLLSHEQAARISPYIMPSAGVKRDDYEFISRKVLK